MEASLIKVLIEASLVEVSLGEGSFVDAWRAVSEVSLARVSVAASPVKVLIEAWLVEVLHVDVSTPTGVEIVVATVVTYTVESAAIAEEMVKVIVVVRRVMVVVLGTQPSSVTLRMFKNVELLYCSSLGIC